MLPMFVNSIFFGALLVPTRWDANFSIEGENFITVPTPSNSTTCGLDEALSLIVTVPESGPCACGVNLAVIVQSAPAERFPLHVVSPSKGEPLKVTEEILSEDVPLLVRVALIGALVVSRSWVGKVKGVVGEKRATPVFRRTYSRSPPWSATVISSFRSSLKSARATAAGNSPAGYDAAGSKVPLPLPSSTKAAPELTPEGDAVIRSGMPSPFTSPEATPNGEPALYETGF